MNNLQFVKKAVLDKLKNEGFIVYKSKLYFTSNKTIDNNVLLNGKVIAVKYRFYTPVVLNNVLCQVYIQNSKQANSYSLLTTEGYKNLESLIEAENWTEDEPIKNGWIATIKHHKFFSSLPRYENHSDYNRINISGENILNLDVKPKISNGEIFDYEIIVKFVDDEDYIQEIYLHNL